jgi:hypothetical protein
LRCLFVDAVKSQEFFVDPWTLSFTNPRVKCRYGGIRRPQSTGIQVSALTPFQCFVVFGAVTFLASWLQGQLRESIWCAEEKLSWLPQKPHSGPAHRFLNSYRNDKKAIATRLAIHPHPGAQHEKVH